MSLLSPRTVFVPGLKPKKSEIIQLLEGIRDGSIFVVARDTKANLLTVTPEAEDGVAPVGYVLSDPVGSNNGVYSWTGSTWVRERGFPDTLSALTNVGGTANAVTAETRPGIDPAEVVVYLVQPAVNNTGAMTLAINGGDPKPILDVNGAAMAAGLWTAGRLIQFVDNGDEYRLISDPDADGASASAAASSQEARDALTALLQKFLGRFVDNTAASVAAAAVPGGAVSGMIYWNTTSSVFRYWDGDSWETIPYATVADGAITAAKLETALAAQVVPRTSSLTINVPTDYPTVQEAIEAASMIRFKAGRIVIVNIESGHLISTPIELVNTNFSGLTINSVDAVVGLDDSFPKIFPAARWDGAGTRCKRDGAALSGVVDGKKGIVSFWAKFNGGDSSAQPLIRGRDGTNLRFTVFRHTDGKWYVQGRDSAGTLVLSISSNSVWNVADGYHHVFASWDLATGRAQLYINDIDDRAAAPTVTNTAIDYTVTDWGFGCEPTSAADQTPTFNGDLAEVYINLAESIDLSVEGNRRKFRQASGAPEVLGKFATRPTGTRPALSFGGVFQSFRVNKGTGGKFTSSGSFTPAPNYPDGTSAGEAAGDGAHILSLRNCSGITWNILVDGDGHAFQGMDLYRSDLQVGGTGKGIKNCLEDNIEANKGCRVTARDSIFSGAGYRGIQVDGGSYVDGVGANVSESFWGVNAQNGSLFDGSPEGGADSPVNATGCYDRAVIADELSKVTLWQADLTGCGGTYCVEIASGANVYMESARTNNSGALVGFFYKPSLTDINVAAFNTLYHNGVVFAPTWVA
ncbi:hypothetical protein ASD04_14995 [Devosia sp. Root436]|uniref:LamG-like jellyroll fold domain-containing protein n=1 Tax=Devosia sp. Root436 TaxID=1736537 RepID=UPI0006FD2BBF|nr:LamG-like jellyroll fold domain-containing protein [Devosia sp. Root436]KQX35344.1 hypothetical protein ASD04_14995 [Devosia sp. Root436]